MPGVGDVPGERLVACDAADEVPADSLRLTLVFYTLLDRRGAAH
jgi:hypothetical protein